MAARIRRIYVNDNGSNEQVCAYCFDLERKKDSTCIGRQNIRRHSHAMIARKMQQQQANALLHSVDGNQRSARARAKTQARVASEFVSHHRIEFRTKTTARRKIFKHSVKKQRAFFCLYLKIYLSTEYQLSFIINIFQLKFSSHDNVEASY